MNENSMSPREYCAHRRIPAFLRSQPVPQPGDPVWKKINGGLIAVIDGGRREYVAAGLVFGVELDEDGTPRIYSYWPGDPADGPRVRKPYALSTCKMMARQGSFFPRPVTYIEMARSVRLAYPLSWLPKEKEFLAEFGIGIDR